MEALKKKWNSRRGASILLALLFLLVCMMVGASIVMAAASNAGKTNSNKTEQQKYLTVSSALTLLVEELESIEYVGRYTYALDDWMDIEIVEDQVYNEETGEWDTVTYTIETPHIKHIYTQRPGLLRLQDDPDEEWDLKDVLYLSNELDKVFAEALQRNMTAKGCSCNEENYYKTHEIHREYTPRSLQAQSLPSSYQLTFTVTLTAKEKEIYGGLSDPVYIDAELRLDGSIFLTATLKDDSGHTDYTMKALLEPESGKYPKDQLVLPGQDPVEQKTYLLAPYSWKLAYIIKTGKEADVG